MKSSTSPSPAVAAAKNVNGRDRVREVVLATGDRARIMPVTASMIDAVTSMIPDPKPPVWYNPNKPSDKFPEGEPEPNPNHPDYLKALDDANRERGIAAMDALVMFGVELLDGVPEDDRWIAKLRYMEKKGRLSLDGYDLEDPMDREFLYKRFIAVDNDVIVLVSEVSGISPAEVDRAEDSFQGD